MNGIELSEKFYYECGAPMIKSEFPELEGVIAVGIAGAGSECFGFDDEISRDHDFEPGFCMFIPGEDVIDSRTEFRLERAYAKLPKTFEGVERLKLNPVGGSRHGVIRTASFYEAKTGSQNGELSVGEWLSIPETYLAEATNGKIFRDDYGEFSAIRARLMNMPDDVRNKKLAGNLVLMAQSGQYNYGRCIGHGETAAAQLAVGEFVNNTLAAVFRLNNKYMPFYKWSFRALAQLEKLSELASPLEILLTTGNTDELAQRKQGIMDEISLAVIEELKAQNLTEAKNNDLGVHAYSVNERVKDPSLRNANILSAV